MRLLATQCKVFHNLASFSISFSSIRPQMPQDMLVHVITFQEDLKLICCWSFRTAKFTLVHLVSRIGPLSPLSCRVEVQPRSNSPTCYCPVVLKTLISLFRCVWLGLKVNSAGPPSSELSSPALESHWEFQCHCLRYIFIDNFFFECLLMHVTFLLIFYN